MSPGATAALKDQAPIVNKRKLLKELHGQIRDLARDRENRQSVSPAICGIVATLPLV